MNEDIDFKVNMEKGIKKIKGLLPILNHPITNMMIIASIIVLYTYFILFAGSMWGKYQICQQNNSSLAYDQDSNLVCVHITRMCMTYYIGPTGNIQLSDYRECIN